MPSPLNWAPAPILSRSTSKHFSGSAAPPPGPTSPFGSYVDALLRTPEATGLGSVNAHVQVDGFQSGLNAAQQGSGRLVVALADEHATAQVRDCSLFRWPKHGSSPPQQENFRCFQPFCHT